MAGAAFYDLEGTLVSTNLVHTLSFYARRQQGLMESVKKSAATFFSLPLFAVTDQYSRKVFNDLYFIGANAFFFFQRFFTLSSNSTSTV